MHLDSLFMVNTGNGKGKTTAGIGSVIRALGHGHSVCMIQFIKGKWQTGERKFIESLSDRVDYHIMGHGFTWDSDDPSRDRRAGIKAWELAVEKMKSGDFDLIVLDELTYLVHYGWLDEDDALKEIQSRHNKTSVLATGRHAPDIWLNHADLVSEVQAVKHPYSSGYKAKQGIDF